MRNSENPLGFTDQLDINISPTDSSSWDGKQLNIKENQDQLTLTPETLLDLYRKAACELRRLYAQTNHAELCSILKRGLFAPKDTFGNVSCIDHFEQSIKKPQAALEYLLNHFVPVLDETLQILQAPSLKRYEQHILFNLYKLLTVHFDTLKGVEDPKKIIRDMSGDTKKLLRSFGQLESLVAKLAKRLKPETIIRHRAAAILLNDVQELQLTRIIAEHMETQT